MTRDEVIALAREAGLNVVSFYDGDEVFEGSNTYFKQTNLIEHFAALVAAHEREACARICDGYNDPLINTDAAAAIRSRT